MTPKRIAILVILCIFAIFVIQNAQVVEVRFLFWRTEASRAVVLLLALAIGILSGWLLERTLHKKRS